MLAFASGPYARNPSTIEGIAPGLVLSRRFRIAGVPYRSASAHRCRIAIDVINLAIRPLPNPYSVRATMAVPLNAF